MTQNEREILVERYLGGDMSSGEESEFFLHVAVDGDLQRTLKAYRVMNDSFRSARELSAVAPHAPYRTAVMTMLAATPAVTISAGAASGATSAGAAGSGSAAAVGAGIGAKVAVGLLAAGVVATSGWLALRQDDPSASKGSPTPAVRQVPAPVILPPVPTEAEAVENAPPEAPVSSAVKENERSAPRRSTRSAVAPAERPSRRPSAATPPASSTPSRSNVPVRIEPKSESTEGEIEIRKNDP